MTLVDSVRWDDVDAYLADEYLAVSTPNTCRADRLAGLVDAARRNTVISAVRAGAPGLTAPELVAVADWFADTATAWLLSRIEPTERTITDAPAAPSRPSGRLSLAPTIAALDLPLIPLAEDLAAAEGDLSVAAGTWDSANGWWNPADRVIVIDPRGQHPATTWAHELSHALDSTGTGSTERERFADALAPLLLHHEPTTLTAAAPLIGTARGITRELHRRPADLPEPGVPSLLVFATLLPPPSIDRGPGCFMAGAATDHDGAEPGVRVGSSVS